MTDGSIHQLVALLHAQLPEDGSPIGNGSLFELLKLAAQHAALPLTEDDFHEARARLVAAGTLKKGKGRGGSSARVLTASEGRPADWLAAATSTASTGTSTTAPQPARSDAADADRPAFALQGEVQPAELPFNAPAPAPARKPAGRPQASAAPGDPQVLSYRHPDRRANNPEVGLVSEASDPERPKAVWAYDPHLDPVLNFDSARARAESLIDGALAGDDPAAMRAALEELRRLGSPYLQWTGKAERTSFEVDTVSLHVHERIDPMSILSAVSKAREWANSKAGKGTKPRSGGIQPGLFEAPFESLPLRDAVDFYRHDKGWSNRLIAGDSLLVMNSLLQKESMAGQVQMIYIDPPYGIKYGSNFQPFTNKREVKDRADADLTQEPEMIKAFRDTWELGIHSYLTYLRDRLLVAYDLLSETGSIFVQISDENLHHVREVMDERFGSENFVALITVAKTSSASSELLAGVADYLVWYSKDATHVKYRALYQTKSIGGAGTTQYNLGEAPSGLRRPLATDELKACGYRLFSHDNMTSQRPPGNFPVEFQGLTIRPPNGYWKTGESGLPKLAKSRRLMMVGNTLRYVSLSRKVIYRKSTM